MNIMYTQILPTTTLILMIAQPIFFVSLCVRGIVVKCGESLSFISTGNYKKLILSEIKEVFLLVCTVRSSH